MSDPQLRQDSVSGARQPRPRKVYLTRHGISTWNEIQRTSGQLDPPLAQRGKALAERLAGVMRDIELTAVYCSTLTRCIETARPTASLHGLRIKTLDELREQHLGVLQGRYRDKRDPEAQQIWTQRSADRIGFTPPGGESYEALTRRVTDALAQIMQDQAHGTVLIVGHRITNRVLLQALLGWSAHDTAQLTLRSKFLYEVVPGTEPTINTILLSERKAGRRHEGFLA